LIAFKNMLDKLAEKRLESAKQAKVVQRARVTGTDI